MAADALNAENARVPAPKAAAVSNLVASFISVRLHDESARTENDRTGKVFLARVQFVPGWNSMVRKFPQATPRDFSLRLR